MSLKKNPAALRFYVFNNVIASGFLRLESNFDENILI